MTTNTVAVWSADQAAKDLTRAVRAKKGTIADLLGVDPDSERGKQMLDRFVSVALHAATSDTKILRATKESVVQAIRDSALLGLEPVGITGDGAIVVYEERFSVEVPSRNGGTHFEEKKIPIAHFQPMYRGLLKLARRSDQLAHIDAAVVYRGDTIELDLGSSPSVRHIPVLDGAERGGYVGAYAVAETVGGRRYVDWMTEADIEVVRTSSRGGTKPDSPWVRYWPEMARKTVLRRLMKRLPLETMAEHGLRLEAEIESGGRGPSAPLPELEAPAESSARRRLRSRFVADPTETSPPEDGGAVATLSPPETTNPAADAIPAGSGRPTGGEVVDGSFTEVPAPLAVQDDRSEATRRAAGDLGGVCGAGSDPMLGDVETCKLPPGHTLPDNRTPSPHESKEGSRWPNR